MEGGIEEQNRKLVWVTEGELTEGQFSAGRLRNLSNYCARIMGENW